MIRLALAFVVGFGLAYLWQHKPVQPPQPVAPCGVKAGLYAPNKLEAWPWAKEWKA